MNKKDFQNFIKSRGISSTTFGDYQRLQCGYISPTIIEERQLNVAQMDVFSRLMMDRIIFFGSEVDEVTANVVVSQLIYLQNQDSEAPIKMYINSPGGSVYDGYSIIDTMDFITCPVETTCTGLAASFGAMMLMCGEKGSRYALPHARIMVHQPLGSARGQASDIQIVAEEIQKIKNELQEIASERTGKPIEEIIKAFDRDCWMTAQEAKDFGIIDEVVTKDKKKK